MKTTQEEEIVVSSSSCCWLLLSMVTTAATWAPSFSLPWFVWFVCFCFCCFCFVVVGFLVELVRSFADVLAHLFGRFSGCFSPFRLLCCSLPPNKFTNPSPSPTNNPCVASTTATAFSSALLLVGFLK